MAESRICSVEGCGKPVEKRGWCTAHYKRWRRHGNPEGGGPKKGQVQEYYRNIVLKCERGPDDECLIWPYSKSDGRGQISFGGQPTLVSRLVCEEKHGPAPTPDHEAAHSCGKGNQGCVTKGHIRWATPSENQMDRVDHGTSNRGERHAMSKLSQEQVLKIRSLQGKMLQRDIAKMFGVCAGTISEIHQRRTWSWL